jgi:hypothetical protein
MLALVPAGIVSVFGLTCMVKALAVMDDSSSGADPALLI